VYLYEHINTSYREMFGNTSGDGTKSSFNGLQAPEFSFKFRFFGGEDFIPMTAVILSTGIPALAGEKFKLKHFNPDLKLACHNELSDKFDLEYNFGLSWNTEDKTKTGFYTLSLNYAPFQIASVYIESFTYYQKELVPDYNLDFGFSFILKKNMEADIYAGTQLREQPNILFGAGFSIRLPK
jgi:hypothetical protein